LDEVLGPPCPNLDQAIEVSASCERAFSPCVRGVRWNGAALHAKQASAGILRPADITEPVRNHALQPIELAEYHVSLGVPGRSPQRLGLTLQAADSDVVVARLSMCVLVERQGHVVSVSLQPASSECEGNSRVAWEPSTRLLQQAKCGVEVVPSLEHGCSGKRPNHRPCAPDRAVAGSIRRGRGRDLHK
jgi:hypothetical protein